MGPVKGATPLQLPPDEGAWVVVVAGAFVVVSWGIVGPGFVEVVVTSGGFWVGPTLPGLILMSEHPRKVS